MSTHARCESVCIMIIHVEVGNAWLMKRAYTCMYVCVHTHTHTQTERKRKRSYDAGAAVSECALECCGFKDTKR